MAVEYELDDSAMSQKARRQDASLGCPLVKTSEIYLDHAFNSREHFGPGSCIELARDLRERGLLQPITIRELRDEDIDGLPAETDLLAKGFKYKIIAGHRRKTAYAINKHPVIPAYIRPKNTSEFECHDINAIENLQRKELTLFEEAMSIKHYWIADWDPREVADRVNKSPAWVQHRYYLLDMPKVVQEMAQQGYVLSGDIPHLYKYRDDVNELKKAAGVLRDARQFGKKNVHNLIKRKDKASTKKIRGTAELQYILDLLQETMKAKNQEKGKDFVPVEKLLTPQGNSFPTAVLAWAVGNITTGEFYLSMRDYCEAFGIIFIPPELRE